MLSRVNKNNVFREFFWSMSISIKVSYCSKFCVSLFKMRRPKNWLNVKSRAVSLLRTFFISNLSLLCVSDFESTFTINKAWLLWKTCSLYCIYIELISYLTIFYAAVCFLKLNSLIIKSSYLPAGVEDNSSTSIHSSEMRS